MKAIGRMAIAHLMLVTVAGCASPSSTPALSIAPDDAPIGSWTVTITEDDFRQAGLTDPGMLDENVGTLTLTFDADGTWTGAMQASRPVKWPVHSGTWIPAGPKMIGMRTGFPADYAGDYVAVQWSIEADGLHLRLVSPQDPVLLVHLETRPWSPAP
jgi:hypothetical protein